PSIAAAGSGQIPSHRFRRASPGAGERLAYRPGRPAGNQYHAGLGRVELVLPAVYGPSEQRGAGQPGSSRLLAAGGSVPRRPRTCDGTPAVRAFLDEIPVRPGADPHSGTCPETD